MARGAPDYSNVLSQQAIYTLLDLGELAARLGSIDVFDRSGNLVWMDDFEGNILQWDSDATGTGGSVALSTTYALRGIQSCKLIAPSDLLRRAFIGRPLAYPMLGRYSFEIAFAVDANLQDLDLMIIQYSVATEYDYRVRYDAVNSLLKYFDPTGAWVTFASGVQLSSAARLYHVGKITVDMTTHKYVRFILDAEKYDLSNYSPYPTALVSTAYIYVVFTQHSKLGVNATVYVDNALVKQNEP